MAAVAELFADVHKRLAFRAAFLPWLDIRISRDLLLRCCRRRLDPSHALLICLLHGALRMDTIR